jgi:hypothetical protein
MSENSRVKGCTAHLIPQPKLLLREFHAPANALRHTEPLFVQLARELEADPAQARGAAFDMDAHAGGDLANDIREVPSLDACGGVLSAI